MFCEDKECPYYDAFIKQTEVTQSLTALDVKLVNLLSQYMNVEEYEEKLKKILRGDDVEI